MHNPKSKIMGCDKLPHLTGIWSQDSKRLGRKINLSYKSSLFRDQLLSSDDATRSKPTLWRCPLDYDNLDRYLSYIYDYNAFYEPGVVAYSFSWSFGSHILSGLQLNKTFLSSP